MSLRVEKDGLIEERRDGGEEGKRGGGMEGRRERGDPLLGGKVRISREGWTHTAAPAGTRTRADTCTHTHTHTPRTYACTNTQTLCHSQI